MLLIPCPWCGPRAHVEFTYAGDASTPPPAEPDATSDIDWHTHLHLRRNPAGPHAEFWHHSHGCRMWLRILRDTVTHEILASAPSEEPLPPTTDPDDATVP
jgi:heterotetrameric sarcosine oxidase delta subunit